MALIFNINDIPEERLRSVGGKARGLARLCSLGFSVPDAFVVTSVNEDDKFDDAVAEYERCGGGMVSVRSSSTLEDGEDFSAAGQFSTFLNVEGASAVRQAIIDCVASLHNGTIVSYANDFLKGNVGKMNVVVQRMIDPRAAGVIFTRAPLYPGAVLVEAVPGLGENLVSGKMSAQQYRIYGKAIESRETHPYLSEDETLRLANCAKLAEKAFEMPLDLEWAIDKEGKIWWLQARPITVRESVTINELDCKLDAKKFVYTTGNIGEMMPGAVTPLNLSTNMYALDWGVQETYRKFGAAGKDVPPFSFIAPYYNHMFFNMTNMYLASHSIYGSTKETMDTSICGHVLEGFPDIDMKDLPPLRRLLNTIPFMKLVFSGEAAKAGMERVARDLKFDLDTDMQGIYAQIIRNFDSLKQAQYYHYCASYYSGGQSNLLLLAADKAFPDKNELQAVIAGCLSQIDGFESADITYSMRMLAEVMLRDDPNVKEYDFAALDGYFASAPAEVRQALDSFMERHGHRGIREPEIMSRPWRENRESFYSSLKSVLSSFDIDSERENIPWTQYQEDLVARCGSKRRKMLEGMVRRARKGVRYREFTKSRTIYVLDQFRKAYRTLASLMVENGILPEEDDIFFLLQDEIGQLLGGDRSLVKKAVARKRLFPMQQKLKFPYCQIGVPVPVSVQNGNSDAIMLQGTPVSRGVATGPARIVRAEADAAGLQPGEIMVVESTDIGWTPYYGIVSGLVTEIGSSLSHGIVVAREYALPSVVNVPNALEIIRDGDEITIDGNAGKVTIERK